MCSACGSSRSEPPQKKAKGRRLRPWEMRANVACSVVGTCLSDRDLYKILKRLRLTVAPDLPSYDLHAHFVEAMTVDGAMARAVQKLLDKRHETILRRVARESDPDALRALWDQEFAKGRIAGVYWAFQTHEHIPQHLHVHVFGEVHMLSHILGRAVHIDIEQVDTLKSRVGDLEALMRRMRSKHVGTVAQKDERIKALERALHSQSSATGSHRNVGHQWTFRQERKQSASDKQARAVIVARQRARAAEAEAKRLAEANTKLRDNLRAVQRAITRDNASDEDDCPGAVACKLDLPKDERLRVLYLGGRTGSIEQLRAIAERASAEFYHHDGGLHESFHQIEPLIDKCHVVFCPVDCVSHRACLVAKGQCKRLNKGFVALASAGQTTFARALRSVET